MAISIIMWVILGLLVLFGLIAIMVAKKGKKRPTDYYSLFVMGIIWLPFGIVFMTIGNNSIGPIFFILGLAYIALGLANKDKWKKNHTPFNKLPKGRKRNMIIVMIVLGLLVLAGLVAFYLVRKGVI